MSHNTNLETLEVGPEALGRLLRLSGNSITRLAATAGLPKTARGSYNVAECLRWHLARVAARVEGTAGDITAERAKLITSQREGQDLANAEARAAMLSADLVKVAIQEMLSRIGARLDAIPATVVTQVGNQRDPVAIARIVSAAAWDARRLAAGDIRDFAASLDDGKP